MTAAVQLSLFNQPQERIQPAGLQSEPTHQQLLNALETLFQATEACCDLPEAVIDPGVNYVLIKKGDPYPLVPNLSRNGKTFVDDPVTVLWTGEKDITVAITTGCGIASATPRHERLCPGYANRQRVNEYAIITMIYYLYIVVFLSELAVFQLREKPARALVHASVDVASAWSQYHPQPTQEQEERLHELNALAQGRGLYPDEYRQGRRDYLLTWFQSENILFKYDEENHTYSFANRG